MTVVWADSGSSTDIQDAVDQVISQGGGTVIIPSGEFYWVLLGGQTRVVIDTSLLPSDGYLEILGAGAPENGAQKVSTTTMYGDPRTVPATILRANETYSWGGFIKIAGTAKRKVRISGIAFMGTMLDPVNNWIATFAIFPDKADEFRIDHCFFDSFGTGSVHLRASRGLIDHCDFDNTFVEHQSKPPNELEGSYNIGAFGDAQIDGGHWLTSLDQILGKWDNGVSYMAGPYYIEDCTFRMGRHAIGSGQYAFYVARHCKFLEPLSTGMAYIDLHGAGFPATRGAEVYNNELYTGSGVGVRGGGGVIWNNTFHDCPHPINLSQDSPTPVEEQVHDLWVWENNFINSPAFINVVVPHQPGVDYFADIDSTYHTGVTDPAPPRLGYMPYSYPHPLTGENGGLPKMEKTRLAQKTWKRKSKLF